MRVKSTSVVLLAVFVALSARTSDATKAGQAASVPSRRTSSTSRLLTSERKHATLTNVEPTTNALSPSQQQLSITPRGGGASAFVKDLLVRLKIASYFALWYALNIVYNIINKKVLNELPLPLAVGSFQFGIGALYVASLWILKLRTKPTLSKEGKHAMTHIGFHHMAGQLLSMVSLGAGPVSFTHIVKALEPFFSAMVSAVYLKKRMKWPVYATLLPVVGGVGYACLKERSFSWLAFWTAMGSNLAFALRAVLSKSAMTSNNLGTFLSSTNVFGLVTWAAFILSIPVALIGEGGIMQEKWKAATTLVEAGQEQQFPLMRSLIMSGLFHYLNNEVMYLALGNVHPVTLAVGNTMKRVFIMVASVLVFRNPVSLQAGIGAAIGISGVLLYSLTKQHYEALEAAEAAAAAAAKSTKGRSSKKKR